MSPDMIVIRHASSGAPHQLARICRASIINAGDGMHEHPTQALLDAFTMLERKGRLAGPEGGHRRRPAAQPRVPLERAAADARWAPRSGVRPGDAACRSASSGSACARPRRSTRRWTGADVVMMLRVQHERMQGLFLPSVREYFTLFGLTAARLDARGVRRDRHAPGPDEPGRRDRLRRRRRTVVGDPRPGGQRRGGADGGAVSARRR